MKINSACKFPFNQTCLMTNIRGNHGYILPSVLLISFLIITLLFGILSVIWFNHTLDIKRINKKKLDLACYSAVHKHLILFAKDSTGGSYYTKIDSIDVLVNYHIKGLYYSVSAKSIYSRDSSKVNYLLARDSTKEFQNALIFSRPNITPVTVGDTKIIGNILINGTRITRGNIFGIKNSTDSYVDGSIKTSSTIEPKLMKESLIKCLFDKVSFSNNSSSDKHRYSSDEIDTANNITIQGDLTIGGTSTIPDNHKEHQILVQGKVYIENSTALNRDIEIYCDSTVEIGNDSKLENILIASKGKIIVKDNCELKGTQLFSKRGIEINKSVLKYPSIVCLYNVTKDSSKVASNIELKSSVVNGSVILVTDVTGLSDNKSKVFIDEKSKVQGIVYSENNAEIKGTIIGSLYVYNLWFYKDPTEYLNWMVNLHVNRKDLSSSFLMPLGFNDSKEFKVLMEVWEY